MAHPVYFIFLLVPAVFLPFPSQGHLNVIGVLHAESSPFSVAWFGDHHCVTNGLISPQRMVPGLTCWQISILIGLSHCFTFVGWAPQITGAMGIAQTAH